MLSIANEELIAAAKEARALPVFSDEVMDFLADVSKRAIRVGRSYPAITSFGYWCRPAALKSYLTRYLDDPFRIGRGLAFHVAPSNVPVNFAFSLASGLLAGNANIVRVPSKDFDEVVILSNIIDAALAEHPDMAPYVNLVRYDRNGPETGLISSRCDARVIWGGNETVSAIRKNPIPPRAVEVTFADRQSIAVIDVQAYLDVEDKPAFANSFYNDTYLSDQNACTSPRLIVWVGDEDAAKDVQRLFWDCLSDAVLVHGYETAPVYAVGKLAAFYKSAAHRRQRLEKGKAESPIMRVMLDELDANLLQDCYHSGFFFEYVAKEVDEVLLLLDNPSIQTVSYVGESVRNQLAALVTMNGIAGVDRIVPVGSTMDFDLTWDGTDLIRALSRVVSMA